MKTPCRTLLLAVLTLCLAPAARADLGGALNPLLPWSTGMDRPWMEVYDITHDDESAARSAFVSAGQSTWLRTTVTGPGRLEFWWKVSTDYDFGYLRCSVLGQRLEISGEVDWEPVSIPLPAGQHVIEWTYGKLPGFFMIGDAAWLDEVFFTPGDNPPEVIRPPVDASLVAGQPLVLAPFIAGSLPMSFQWHLNGAPVAGATQAVLQVSRVLTNQAGPYRVVAANAWGAVTSAPAQVTVALDPLAVSLNAPHLLWETTPYAPWEPQSVFTRDGVSAAQSARLFNNEASALATTVDGPGEISFWWKVDSDGDALSFSINNVEQDFIHGDDDWQRRSFAVPPGPAVLEWVYIKDAAGSAGEDAGWLDEVMFAPGSPAPRLAAPRWTQGVFALQTPTRAGRQYTLEYQSNLGSPSWTNIVTVAGDGTVKTLTDPGAAAQRRFYRVREF